VFLGGSKRGDNPENEIFLEKIGKIEKKIFPNFYGIFNLWFMDKKKFLKIF
jgi:hypothetical protein